MKVRLLFHLALIEISPLFLRKLPLISMRTASLTQEKQGGFYPNKVNTSLTFIEKAKHITVKWSVDKGQEAKASLPGEKPVRTELTGVECGIAHGFRDCE